MNDEAAPWIVDRLGEQRRPARNSRPSLRNQVPSGPASSTPDRRAEGGGGEVAGGGRWTGKIVGAHRTVGVRGEVHQHIPRLERRDEESTKTMSVSRSSVVVRTAMLLPPMERLTAILCSIPDEVEEVAWR